MGPADVTDTEIIVYLLPKHKTPVAKTQNNCLPVAKIAKALLNVEFIN